MRIPTQHHSSVEGDCKAMKENQINFEAPEELQQDFDDAIKGTYASRSEALRDLMRQYIAEKSVKQNLARSLRKRGFTEKDIDKIIAFYQKET